MHALSTFSQNFWPSLPRPRIISFRRCDPWKSNTLAPVAATARPTRQLRVRSTQLWKSLRRVGSSPPAPLYPAQLPVVESCSKSIAKSRYIASTVITRKIVFAGLRPDNIETFWLLAIHEPPLRFAIFTPFFFMGAIRTSRFDIANISIYDVVWNGLASAESKTHDSARFENITLWLRNGLRI